MLGVRHSMVKSHERSAAGTAVPQVFISYAWGNGLENIVKDLREALRAEGFTVYSDNGGKGGPPGDTEATIKKELDRSFAAVVLLSPKYYDQEKGFRVIELRGIKDRMEKETILVVPILCDSSIIGAYEERKLGIEHLKPGNLPKSRIDSALRPLRGANLSQKSATYANVVAILKAAGVQASDAIEPPTNFRVHPVPSPPTLRIACALHISNQTRWVRWRANRFEIAASDIISDQAELNQTQNIAVDGAGGVVGCLDSSNGHVRLAWLDRYSTEVSDWPHMFRFSELKDCRLLAIKRSGDTAVRMIVSSRRETVSLWLSATMSQNDKLDQGVRLSSSSSLAAVWLPEGPLLIGADTGRPSRSVHGLTLDAVQHLDAAYISRKDEMRAASVPSHRTTQFLIAAVGVRRDEQMLEVRFADGTGRVVPLDEDPVLATVIRNGDNNHCVVMHGKRRDSIRTLSLEN